MSSVKIDSDQSGYAGIMSSWAIAFRPRTITPTQRENWFLTSTPTPTASSTTLLKAVRAVAGDAYDLAVERTELGADR
jgi:hypothetical protein